MNFSLPKVISPQTSFLGLLAGFVNHFSVRSYKEECAWAEVRERELIDGGRRRVVSDVRAIIAHRCAEEVGVSAAEIARHLGVTTSSITRGIAKAEEQMEK